MENVYKFQIGDTLQDKVTGFKGLCMARSEYSTGCKHYGLLSPKLSKEGQIQNGYEWLDESRLKRVSKGKKIKKKPTGGPVHNPPSL